MNLFAEGDQNQGVKAVITMKRRIVNEVLTTYLPTLFIIAIVWTTNYYGNFFFEAIVTVNLTALLVLTTLFIGVAGTTVLPFY